MCAAPGSSDWEFICVYVKIEKEKKKKKKKKKKGLYKDIFCLYYRRYKAYLVPSRKVQIVR